MVNSTGIHPHNNLFLICELQWTQKKDKQVVSSKSGIGLLPKNIQNIEHICWEAIHTKSAVQTHGQLQTPSWSVTVSFAWSSHVSISKILTSIHFLEDGTGLTQFLYLFHKIQISTWKPTPWRYPYVVLAASPESQFLWKLRVATGLRGRLLSDLTFAKFPLVLLHAQNLIRYHHLSSHHLHHPLRNALVFQTLKQPSLRHSFQAVSKLPKAHSPHQHPSTCHLCVVVPCMLLFSCPFWVILDDNVRWPIFVSKLETTTQIILSHTKISHFGWV